MGTVESSQLGEYAGPVPDAVTIWPLEGGYGLDATFQGASGYDRAAEHERLLQQSGTTYSFRQELAGGWTLRFGPLSAAEVSRALQQFVV